MTSSEMTLYSRINCRYYQRLYDPSFLHQELSEGVTPKNGRMSNDLLFDIQVDHLTHCTNTAELRP